MCFYRKDKLFIKKAASRQQSGTAAASDISLCIRRLLEEKQSIRMIFAAAPSQNEFLEALVADKRIDFSRITAFHMDEYIGLAPDAPQGFANFLDSRLFSKASFGKVHYINGQASDLEEECLRYAHLLRESEIDIVCMGIGENAHIAFNDPVFADFEDPTLVKVIRLDDICRRQQVNDGCFKRIEDVPLHAITLTIPALTQAGEIFCIVPAKTKCNAVYNSLHKPVSPEYPASFLRCCSNATLYLDAESGARLSEVGGLEKIPGAEAVS